MTTMNKISEASERNKGPILEVIRDAFKDVTTVLEIGSGTGQHAVHFTKNLRHLSWQPTDLAEGVHGLRLMFEEQGNSRIKDAIALDVSEQPWPVGTYDAVYTANTFHIMSEAMVEEFFSGLEWALRGGGTLCVYGPFNYRGKYTSESNKSFDEFLRGRDPESGIRDYEWVDSLASEQGLELISDHEMPANNRLLEWRKNI